jgi:methyl-accepting chemotaxis protein
MRLLKLDTIGKKLMIPITALTMILLVGLGTSMILNTRSSVQSMMDSKGNSLANLLEKISAPYIINYDYPALDGFVQEAIKDPDVAFAVFHDAGGQTLTRNSKVPSDISALAIYERDIKGEDGKKAAILKIGYNKNTLSKILRDGIIKIGLSLIIAMILTVLGLTFLIRNITRILKRVIYGMSEGTNTVATVSSQVSSESRTLAEGASTQAASIEETSSSLEEMSSMTKRNAGNAAQADSLMKETNGVVVKANQSMGKLTNSMEEISKASEETSKIIKTIDEIAFQTNLLALNAAVEAARAGEAGAGFAVVSGEVRNLAMRAAEAARNTAALIEGTVKKVKEGTGVVKGTNEAFTEVAKNALKVGELVSEIAAASSEQAQGIDQVNKAVAEMDRVVQQVAASAEENASASEEMNAQAARMKSYVGDLLTMVGGGAERTASKEEYGVPSTNKGKPHSVFSRGEKGLEVTDPARGAKGMVTAIKRGGEMKPEQIIPLKQEDFKDF